MAHLIDRNLDRAREYRAGAGDTVGCAGDLRAWGASLRHCLLVRWLVRPAVMSTA